MKSILTTGLAAIVLAAVTAGPVLAQGTLQKVKDRGQLVCGVNTGIAGFSAPDDKGNWSGLDVDLCRAVAAAIFKDPAKVKFVPLTAKERFTALQSGEIDVLSRNTTWTMSRDTSAGMNFAGINYYDGQGFMVNKALGVKSAKELSGASICVQTGTTTELNVADYFRQQGMTYKPVVIEKLPETLAAYNAGRCDVFTSDASQLYATRLTLGSPADHIVLPEVISKEPLGPAVRQGDAQWGNIVRWVLFALINAEEFAITQENVDKMKDSTNPEVKRLLGSEGDFGKGVGLDSDWAYQAIKAVGNYGESFERNVGQGSRLKISRGQNALWRDGGLQYAPPIR
ncbi:MAG: amino acid ABC transporter substrate-binding protein [Hyphomicrobiaceae bacterium]|nr:amino acid ABC transporter substrate-binding protein [Hyphomicrobiaceae bacterium]MCC0007025.1 amino acid ABC transporter substrate-binding protein [Hyphomicrobiaceae bacterium]